MHGVLLHPSNPGAIVCPASGYKCSDVFRRHIVNAVRTKFLQYCEQGTHPISFRVCRRGSCGGFIFCFYFVHVYAHNHFGFMEFRLEQSKNGSQNASISCQIRMVRRQDTKWPSGFAAQTVAVPGKLVLWVCFLCLSPILKKLSRVFEHLAVYENECNNGYFRDVFVMQ